MRMQEKSFRKNKEGIKRFIFRTLAAPCFDAASDSGAESSEQYEEALWVRVRGQRPFPMIVAIETQALTEQGFRWQREGSDCQSL